MIDNTHKHSTTLRSVEWLFKQSTYGGDEHIVLNISDWADYMEKSRLRDPLYIKTMCGKRLKYNSTFSQMRQHAGLVRQICPDCNAQNESEEKAQEANDRNVAIKERYSNDDAPF